MNTYAQRPYFSIFPIAFGALPAAAITALLVLLMHSLIANDMVPIEVKRTNVAEIVMPDTKPIEFTEKQKPVKPDDATPPPEWQEPLSKLSPDNSELTWLRETPIVAGIDDIEVGVGGGGIVAYLRPQPIYPSRPLSRGIEGYVDLAFDIAATGSTSNIRVIDAQPLGVFERAAIKALEKWKYKVPVVDGVPQGQVDMTTRMRFEVED